MTDRTRHDEITHSRAGDVFVNPVTGERAVIVCGTADSTDGSLSVHLFVAPGGAVAAEHYHPQLVERFRVLSGHLAVSVEGRRSHMGPGDELSIPPGVIHDWWNAGETEAEVLVEVTPGRRFELMVGSLFGLARDGKVNAKGMPNLLQLAVMASEFDDTVRFVKPSPIVQKLLFAVLAPLGRLLGYRPYYAEYLVPAEHIEPERSVLDMVRSHHAAPRTALA
ncbi:MAG TPA: cupin domain-containing protein [Thermoleophilaceae bacterium]